ncbi:Hsp20/alpha crystallin family protein [Gemmatimonas sp.]|uniref:Hsp20/alpha crystallin family protein n=1 Tax=Gemmatimonas sp. TaxID=1962908 RepID=UPI00333EE3B7
MTYTFPIATAFPNASLRREIDRMFDDVFATRAAAPSRQPLAAAREDATGYTLEVDLPGVDPQKVELLAEEGVLTLKGLRAHRALADGETAVFSEVAGGEFVRRFRLPKVADLQSVSASYAHGVLSIRVAKIAPAQPRRVPVTIQSPTVSAPTE